MKTFGNWRFVCDLEDIIPEGGVCAYMDGRQIAIFRVGDNVYAIDNRDPASDANVLSRGIVGDLQGELVVASPIYKHHYSLITGRCIEDPDYSVVTYPARVTDGRVWVRSKPLRLAKGKRKLVVIGNGMAGMRVVEQLTEMAPQSYEITVFGAEPHGNYNRILLSPVLAGEKTFEDIVLHPLEWYREHGVTLHAGDPVIAIDRVKRIVTSQSGRQVPYDRLLLATGSKPIVLPIPGNDLDGVVTFRDLQDVDAMLAAARTHKKAVVIGGGLLGLEAANGLLRQGMDVTVVHISDTLMERQLDATAGALLKQTLEQRGLKFVMPAQTVEILGNQRVPSPGRGDALARSSGDSSLLPFTGEAGASAPGEGRRVRGVRLADGTVLEADLVVMAVGIRPNIDLAKAAGLRCDRGILVNDTMLTFDPSIYAVGECVQHRNSTYGLVAPLWEQAKVCATHLAEFGIGRYQGSIVSTQLKVTGIDVFSAGDFIARPGSETLVLKDLKRGVYKRLTIENNRVCGVVLYGDTRDGPWYFELMQEGRDIGPIRDKLLFGAAYAGATTQ
jgi:nitrite reductase (NADH) large subunit